MIVIADSTPLHYLILIDQTDLRPRLFDRILIPPAVFQELQHEGTPDSGVVCPSSVRWECCAKRRDASSSICGPC